MGYRERYLEVTGGWRKTAKDMLLSRTNRFACDGRGIKQVIRGIGKMHFNLQM
jgi:NRPS condensation-like uncharacterized protein